jgi:hypothetical protein
MNISSRSTTQRSHLHFRAAIASLAMAFTVGAAAPTVASADPINDYVTYYYTGTDNQTHSFAANPGDHLVNLAWHYCACNDAITEVTTKCRGVTLYTDWFFGGTSYYVPANRTRYLPYGIDMQGDVIER